MLHEPSNPLFGVNNPKGRVIVVGIPMEDTVSFKPGTRFSPGVLRFISPYLEATPTEYLGVEPLGEFRDVGDVPLLQGEAEVNLGRVREVEAGLLGSGLVVNIGGEHTLSLAVAKAIRDRFGELGAFIQFDAHLDLRSEWPLGQGLSHATFGRLLNTEVKPSMYVNLGFRGYDEEELNFAVKLRKSILLDSVELMSISPVGLHEVLSGLTDIKAPIHLSIDMDVFDPTIAPGVGNPESGGVDYWAAYRALSVLMPMVADRLVAVDVVEYSPPNDQSNATASLTLKLIVDIANLYLWSIRCRSARG